MLKDQKIRNEEMEESWLKLNEELRRKNGEILSIKMMVKQLEQEK